MILKNFKELRILNNSVDYKGKLKNYQKHGNTNNPIQKYEIDKYNHYQNYLYKRALYGLNMYNEKELKKMSWKKKKRISKVNKKAQMFLNLYKQEKTNEFTNRIFKLFPKSPFYKLLIENFTDPTYINDLDLKSMNITKKDIIKLFIDKQVLPNNFNKLKDEPKI